MECQRSKITRHLRSARDCHNRPRFSVRIRPFSISDEPFEHNANLYNGISPCCQWYGLTNAPNSENGPPSATKSSKLGRLPPTRFAWYASGDQRRHRFLRHRNGVQFDTPPTRRVHITNGSTEHGRSHWIRAPTQKDDAVTPTYANEKIQETSLSRV